jgi:large subunit ribosomal protein L13Ae
VSGTGVCAKRIVVDALHHMFGRLSSIIAKKAAQRPEGHGGLL